jgi:hypothetical protein
LVDWRKSETAPLPPKIIRGLLKELFKLDVTGIISYRKVGYRIYYAFDYDGNELVLFAESDRWHLFGNISDKKQRVWAEGSSPQSLIGAKLIEAVIDSGLPGGLNLQCLFEYREFKLPEPIPPKDIKRTHYVSCSGDIVLHTRRFELNDTECCVQVLGDPKIAVFIHRSVAGTIENFRVIERLPF